MNILFLIFIFLYPILITSFVFFPFLNTVTFLIQTILTIWIINVIRIRYKLRKVSFSHLSKKIHLLIIVFLLLNIVSLIRGYLNDFINQNNLIFYVSGLIFFYCAGLMKSLVSEDELGGKDNTFSLLCFGIVFYVLLNFFILYVLKINLPSLVEKGMEESQGGRSLIGSLLGLDLKRTIFPLSQGFGSTHLASIVGIAGVNFYIKIIYFRFAPKFPSSNMFINCISAIVCSVMLLFLDTRAAIISLILVIIFFFLINLNKSQLKHRINYIYLVLLANFSFPFTYSFVSNFLDPILQEFGLVRGAGYSVFSDREEIWDSVLTFFSVFDLEQIIGYGMWGQYQNGIHLAYENSLFGNNFYSGVKFFSLHSTIFQQLVNIGYFGLLIYVSLTLLSVKSLVRSIKINQYQLNDNHLYAALNLACILYLVIVGNFDPVTTQERIFTTNIYLLLVMSSLRVIPISQNSATEP